MRYFGKNIKISEWYIDAIGDSNYFKNILYEKFKNSKIKFTVEPKADSNYPVVSAASIIAKVKRDKYMYKLNLQKKKIGSGYPFDK